MLEKTNLATRSVGAVLLVIFFGSSATRAADARGPSPNGPADPHVCGQDGRHPPNGPFFGPLGPLGFGEDLQPPYLMGLTLSEDQQDKIFAILHAAAPANRDHMKEARKARLALRDLVESPAFTDDKAASLAQRESAAEAQLSLQRARTDHDIFMVLTPEQRALLAERRHDHDAPPEDRTPPH